MTINTTMNLTEYAISRGVTRQAILKAIESKRVKSPYKVGGLWVIDPEKLDQEWSDNTPVDGRTKTPLATEKALEINEARALKETYLALAAKLDYETKLGMYAKIDDVERQAIAQAKLLKEAFLNLPARINNVLAAESDPDAINNILLDEIRAILEGLSNDF